MGIVKSPLSGKELMVFSPKEIVLGTRGNWGAGSDESVLTFLFWLRPSLFNSFCSFRSFLRKWKKI